MAPLSRNATRYSRRRGPWRDAGDRLRAQQKTRLNHECLHNQLLSRSSEGEARLMRKAETACVHLKESQEEGWREAQTGLNRKERGGFYVGVVLIRE